MFPKNDGVSRDHRIQNIFTAYLNTALERCKEQYLNRKNEIQAHETPFESVEQFQIESVIHDSDDAFFTYLPERKRRYRLQHNGYVLYFIANVVTK